MLDELKLNNLVYNVVTENRYSHCRLCLCNIQQEYVRFMDPVSLFPDSGKYEPLHEVLSSLLGEQFGDEISGIDAVCTECVNTALKSLRFIEKCRKSTNLIQTIFDNLTNALSIDIDSIDKERALYILFENNETNLLWVKKESRNKEYNCSKKQTYFECVQCSEKFQSYFDLKAHNLTIHDTVTCEKCYATFLSDSELELHEINKHKFKCPECSQFKSSEVGLSEHLDRAHTIYVCKECGKSCRGSDNLHIHEDKHNTKNSCPKCGKTYATKEFFSKHVKLCLENLIDPHPLRSNLKKTFNCDKCAKGYSTPGGLRVHNRFVHGNAKPHICNECGKQFTAPSYLRNHMIKHTRERNFICDLCGGRFVSKEALLYHTRRHTGEKPYSCKICNERFVNASVRAEHVKFKHVGPTLMCEICSRKFVTSYFLKQHISRHHDPSSKLYYGRNMIPPNMPGEQNMRILHINHEK